MKPYLTPSEAAPLIGMNPHTLRVTAREAPQKLGFPVIVTGRRVRIPRKPFYEFLGVNA